MSYTLIIKGGRDAAEAACAVHDVQTLSIVRHPNFDECIVITVHDTDYEALAAWFCEPMNGAEPAPCGTLLWYGPRHLAPVETA